jgi:hypothetical protein
MATDKFVTTAPTSSAKLDLYLDRLAAQNPTTGRLIFALDATASREPTWDTAATLTAAMFEAVTALDVQLVYYRGINECRASPWVSDARTLTGKMKTVRCEAGETQIDRILAHARKAERRRQAKSVGDGVHRRCL